MHLSFVFENKITELTIEDEKNFVWWLNRQTGFLKTDLSLNNFLQNKFDNFMRAVSNYNSPKIVLNIGCGIAVCDLAFCKLYPDVKYYLLDNDVDDTNFNDYKYFAREQNKHGFYNSWEVVNNIIKNSNITNDITVMCPNENFPDNIDIVMSYYSWCWHYPKKIYWERTINSLRDGGQLVLSVLYRPDYNVVQEISDYMKSNPIIYTLHSKSIHKNSNTLRVFLEDIHEVDGYIGGVYSWTKNNYSKTLTTSSKS